MIEMLLTAGVALAALVAVVQLHQMERQARIERALADTRHAHLMMVGLLRVWAEHWGEDPEHVKPFLDAVLKTSLPHIRTRVSDSTPMGMDLGFTQLWAHLRRVVQR